MNRRLTVIAMISLVVYILLFWLAPKPVEYPKPNYSKEDIFKFIDTTSKELNIPPITMENAYMIDVQANHSLGRYLDDKKFDKEQLANLEKEVPLYTVFVESSEQIYDIDPNTGLIVGAEGISLPAKKPQDIDQFVTTYFSDDFVLQRKIDPEDDLFADWDIKYIYTAQTPLDDISKVVEVYTIDNEIITFNYYGLADGYPIQNELAIPIMIVYLFILLFMVILTIVVTIQLIVRLFKKKIEAFFVPFILSVVAGLGWFFLTDASGVSLTKGLGFLEPLMMGYLTFATLLIRWKKSSTTWSVKLAKLKTSIWQGFLFTFIGLTLAEVYFLIAHYLGGWVSPIMDYTTIINLNVWLMPFFALFVGLSAAITEEAIFRQYMIPFFDRFGVIVSVLATSVLWGVLHIGYDMHPWYLYIIDFILITGPLFYFIYKKYGFATVVFFHYFYNCTVTIISFFVYGMANIALITILLTGSPLLLLLFKNKQQRI